MIDSDDVSRIWPATHHDLHRPTDSYWSFTDIGRQRRLGLQGRIVGFRRAAEILYTGMLDAHSIRDLDTVIFPYATCWRHHVELQLKSLLAQPRALSDLPAEGRHHHKIEQLWQEVRNLMIEQSPDEKEDLVVVGRVISQLAGLDPDGQSFRYAEMRDGSDTLASVDQMNLVAFHEAMVGIANYLDGADAGTGEYLATKREMDSYYAAEFGNDWSALI